MNYDKIIEKSPVPEKLINDIKSDDKIREKACKVLLKLYERNWRGEQIFYSRLSMGIAEKYDFELVIAEDWNKDKIELSHIGRPFTDDEMFSFVINHVKDLNICDKRLIAKLNKEK